MSGIVQRMQSLLLPGLSGCVHNPVVPSTQRLCAPYSPGRSTKYSTWQLLKGPYGIKDCGTFGWLTWR